MNFADLFSYPRLLIVVALLVVSFCDSVNIQAQTTTPTPIQKTPEEIEQERRLRELTNTIAILEAEQKIKDLNKEDPGKSEIDKRIDEQKKTLELLQAQNAVTNAKYPASTATPLAGTTTITDGAVIESQMIAYTAMAKSANKIIGGIKTIRDKDGKPIPVSNLAIFNEQDVNLMLGYKVAKSQIEIIRQGYCDLIKTTQTDAQCATFDRAPVLPLTIAKSFLGAFVDLTALLRTNVEIKGNTFDIDESPLATEVFRAARKSDGFGPAVALYYPKMFPPDINPNAKSTILTTLDAVNTLRTRAGRIIGGVDEKTKGVEESKGKVKNLKNSIKQIGQQKADLELKKARLLEAFCSLPSRRLALLGAGNTPCKQMLPEARERFFEIRDEIKKLNDNEVKLSVDLTEEQANTANLGKQLEELLNNLKLDESSPSDPNKFSIEDALAQLKARNAQYDKFIESLISVNATGVNALTNFIKAENLKNALPEGSQWLQLKVLKAGGNNRIKTNLIWDVFTGGNRLSHSGGVIVQYILFDDKGKSVASDTITEYTNYIKSSKVKNLPDLTVDDYVLPK